MKCVITAAGRGTRLLPFTKELPKEMMPIFSKTQIREPVVVPLLQYIFEQLFEAGIREYCFVVGREKRSIEDHFTPHESYVNELSISNKALISDFYKKIEKSHLIWVNQNKPMGFGDAVKRAERFVGDDSFIVHAGDVSIISKSKIHPVVRLINEAKVDSSVSAVILCKKVKDTKRYGVPKIKKISSSTYLVEEVEEKPERPKSDFGILPIYFFRSKIFGSLKQIKTGKNKEYQLTDAIQNLIHNNEKVIMIPLRTDEIEIDVGTVGTYKQALEDSYKYA